MPIKVKDSDGTLRTITRMVVADAGGVLRTVRTVKVMDSGGTLRTVASLAPPLTASVSPSAAYGFSLGSPTIATTDSVTATPSGGLSPFTYAWVRLSGSGEALSPTMATTAFRADPGSGGTATGTFRVTVTDAVGQTATASVTATFENSSGGFL